MSAPSPQEELFAAIAWIDMGGRRGREEFSAQIESALDQGADPNGHNRDGRTPLTEAIQGGMGSPTAVAILLRRGADPSLRDAQGWTPWGLCADRLTDPVVAEATRVIQQALAEAGADRADETLLTCRQAMCEGRLDEVRAFAAQGVDLLHPVIDGLACAVGCGRVELLSLVVEAGADVNRPLAGDSTPLVTAAMRGDQAMVEQLLALGADPMATAWGDRRCTAEFMARQEGHDALAAWLRERMPNTPKLKAPPRKYRELYERKTNGSNHGLGTDEIVARLKRWDKNHGVSVSEADGNSFLLRFKLLPEPLLPLARELAEFCPDVIDQGYACMDDMVDAMARAGQPLDAETRALVDGIDFSDDGFAIELLARDLKRSGQIRLWWD